MTKKEKKSVGAEFVSNEYLKSENLLSNDGFILGSLENGDLITDTSNMNVLLLAPTGMGKGVACVIPNLLAWKDSAVVNDIKGENFSVTSGYRKNVLKQDVFLWYPNIENTHYFNPLDILKDKDINAVSLTEKIAKILLPNDDYYSIEARNLLVSIMLYLNDGDKNNFGEIYNILKNGDVEKFIKPSEDAEKIRAMALESIKLWGDKTICNATSKSDFNLKNLNQKATTVYVGISPSDVDRLRSLLQIFYLECFEYLMSDKLNGNVSSNADIKKSTLVVLDELNLLGKMDFIVNKLPYTRGFKVKTILIAQNLDEIASNYGEKALNQIFSNCPYKIIFAPNNYKTAEFVSKTIGDEILVDDNGVKTKQTLIYPEELMNMSKLEEIVILYNSKVIRCNKLFYYRKEGFAEKLLKPITIKKHGGD